jgi:P2-related tail formation protein
MSSLAFWKDASRELRRLTAVMWAIGTVLIAVGWWLDVSGWWEHRPFLTNLASSLTGAFFALPVAVLVIENIRRQEGKWSASLEAKRTLQDLQETALALEREFERTVLDRHFWRRLHHLLANCSQSCERLEQVDTIGDDAAGLRESRASYWTSLAHFKSSLRDLKENLAKLEEFFRTAQGGAPAVEKYYGGRRSVRDFLVRLARDWEFFVKPVSQRLEESRLPLPDGAKVIELQVLMDTIKNGAEDLWKADSEPDFYGRRRREVRQLVEQVEGVLALPDEVIIHSGGIDRSWSLEAFEELVKTEDERQEIRNSEELQKRQGSLKAVKGSIDELRVAVNQVEGFVATVVAVARKLSDMEKEWIGSGGG